MRARNVSTIFILSLSAATLFAHETWIAPNQGYIAPGLSVRLDMSSSGKFPIMETAIEPSRLGKFGVRLGEDVLKPVVTAGPKSLKFNLSPPKEKEGFATAFVSLKPRKLTLTPAQVEEYLEEIGQTAAFLEKWKARPEPRTWREEYTKHAKAFFRVGKATDDSWKAPIGMNLEIVPLSDPTRGSSLEPFRVQVLRGGQPLPAFAVVALVDSTTSRQFATTGPDGVASFKLDRQGRWLIEGTDLRETTKAGLDFESDFATLLVTVIPAKTEVTPVR